MQAAARENPRLEKRRVFVHRERMRAIDEQRGGGQDHRRAGDERARIARQARDDESLG